MKVLIVDDEALVRRSLERVLLSRGHQVITAADGSSGLQAWQKENPDLVFLDVLMPGLSGPQVLAQIDDQSSAVVVLMSAFTGEHNLETAKEMGADLFVSKPFDDIFKVLDDVEELLT